VAKVRSATLADMDALLALAVPMHAESPRYRVMALNLEKVERTFAWALAHGAVLLAETEGEAAGMAIAFAAERWFSDERYATDLLVYVKPEHRGSSAFARLVRAMETWCRSEGIHDLAPGVSTEADALRTVHAYERLGYRLSGYMVSKHV
jgi:GNAT superfamily N-acetyltransferase